MKSKKKKSTGISQRFIIFGIIIFVLLLGVFVFKHNSKNPTSNQFQNTYTITTSPTNSQSTINSEKGFSSGYDENKPRFDLALPSECTISDDKIITCSTATFTITIKPQVAGRGAKVREKQTLQINNFIWNKTILDNDPEFSSTYYVDANGSTYLLGVKYQPFTSEAEKYFETILASFHFINN